MQVTEQEPVPARLSIGWTDGSFEQGDQSLERAAAYAAVLARTLAATGYRPRRLDISLRRGAHGILEVEVRGDVPRMPEPDFASLARVTLHAANLVPHVDGTTDVLLRASLETGERPTDDHDHDLRETVHREPVVATAAEATPSPRPAPARGVFGSLPLGRVAIGLLVGGFLGVLGLPRFDLPFPATSAQPPAVTVVQDVATPGQAAATPVPAVPTPVPAPPTATIAAVPTATPSAPRVLFAERFVSPLPNWPNDPTGTAWFGDGGFRLLARQSGRFVAVGVPLQQAVSAAVITAQFHKVGGPTGGGYGFIIRDQGSTAERDSRSQAGKYMVLEVGDSGDVGVWQRNETRWIDVMPWTRSAAVHTNRDPNVLAVTTRGSALRFEVNDQVVAALSYEGIPPQGGVGIFVGGDLNEVALEWLHIEVI